MTFDEFLDLPAAKIAQLVRESGSRVCAFPINGTRRWFHLEYPGVSKASYHKSYLDAAVIRHIKVYDLFFEHGIDTLMTPIFGPDLMERGRDYMRMATEGMAMLSTHPSFQNFFQKRGVRLSFYGDYKNYFEKAGYASLLKNLQSASERTCDFSPYRLFMGLFAHDATETIARTSVDYYQKHGRVPDKRTIIQNYYGDDVENISFFIGYDRLAVFDVPLLTSGVEDLYFTILPSLYLDRTQLRMILYDHLYTRRKKDRDYFKMQQKDWDKMKSFYKVNRQNIIGVGTHLDPGGFYVPFS